MSWAGVVDALERIGADQPVEREPTGQEQVNECRDHDPWHGAALVHADDAGTLTIASRTSTATSLPNGGAPTMATMASVAIASRVCRNTFVLPVHSTTRSAPGPR